MTYKAVIKQRSIKIPGELIDKYGFKENKEVVLFPTKKGISIRSGKIKQKHKFKGVLSNKIDVEGFEKDIKSLRKEWIL